MFLVAVLRFFICEANLVEMRKAAESCPVSDAKRFPELISIRRFSYFSLADGLINPVL